MWLWIEYLNVRYERLLKASWLATRTIVLLIKSVRQGMTHRILYKPAYVHSYMDTNNGNDNELSNSRLHTCTCM